MGRNVGHTSHAADVTCKAPCAAGFVRLHLHRTLTDDERGKAVCTGSAGRMPHSHNPSWLDVRPGQLTPPVYLPWDVGSVLVVAVAVAGRGSFL